MKADEKHGSRRTSGCMNRAREAELRRVKGMTVEERIKAALSLAAVADAIQPAPRRR